VGAPRGPTPGPAQGLGVGLQDARHHLMHAEDGAGHLFRLRPDIVVSEGARTRCIADTKWKRLDGKDRKLGVSQADLYQMLAYARRYTCDRILMIYPYERSDVPREAGGVMLRYQGQETTVLIGQVCLADLRTVGRQLQVLYARAVGGDALAG
jgi:5-methylcytosine-specific restriction enzyme subunit McrC